MFSTPGDTSFDREFCLPHAWDYTVRSLEPCADQGNQPAACATRKIDPIVVQPLPAADVNRLCAAGVKRMFLGFLFIGGAVVHGLDGRAKQ